MDVEKVSAEERKYWQKTLKATMFIKKMPQ